MADKNNCTTKTSAKRSRETVNQYGVSTAKYRLWAHFWLGYRRALFFSYVPCVRFSINNNNTPTLRVGQDGARDGVRGQLPPLPPLAFGYAHMSGGLISPGALWTVVSSRSYNYCYRIKTVLAAQWRRPILSSGGQLTVIFLLNENFSN